MKSQVRFMLFTFILVLVGASLCFGQAAATRTKPQEKPRPSVAPAPTAPTPGISDVVKFKPGVVAIVQNDGLQCLLANASGLNAAYDQAAQSGCKKVKVGQATLYNCGFHPSAYYDKCLEAKAKIDAIFSKCGITPPVDQGGMAGVSPGCNSLGITCIEDPA